MIAPIAMIPRGMPTPRPILVVFFFEVGGTTVVVGEEVGVVPEAVVASVVVVTVEEVVELVVVVLRVAPLGVKRELVTTAVFSCTDEPTRIEYGGKKSSIFCVLVSLPQVQVGPSAQQYVSDCSSHRLTVLWT